MRIPRLTAGLGILAMVFALAVSGCRSAATPVTFYTLSPIQEAANDAPKASALRELVITVGPAWLPDFMNRPQIVTRAGENRLQLSEFHRWAGDLNKDFLNTLAENLSIRLASPGVNVFPWKEQVTPDYRVALDVHQFEGRMGEAVVLNVTWSVRGRDQGAEPLIIRRSVIRRPVPGSDYDSLVAAHSQAVGELSGEIAAAIMGLAKQ